MDNELTEPVVDDNKSLLENMNNDIAMKTLKDAADEIVPIYEELILNVNKSTIPVSVFKEYFLDFFKNNNSNENNTLALKWIELAGGVYNEVNVIDDNGNIAFVVPGLFAHPEISNNINQMNFSNIANEYMMRKNRMYEDGARFLDSVFASMRGGVTADVQEHVDKWVRVFEYFKDTDAKENQPVKAKAIINNNVDFLDFD